MPGSLFFHMHLFPLRPLDWGQQGPHAAKTLVIWGHSQRKGWRYAHRHIKSRCCFQSECFPEESCARRHIFVCAGVQAPSSVSALGFLTQASRAQPHNCMCLLWF